MTAITPLELADRYFRGYKRSRNEIKPTYCPFCNGGGGHDKYTFSMNLENGSFKCFRENHCGRTGGFKAILEHFGIQPEYNRKQNTMQHVPPKTKLNPPTQKVLDYLTLRKLSRLSINRYNVGEKDGNIAFPYLDEDGQLCLIKYRPARKVAPTERKAWREAGGKDVLFGWHLCDTTFPLVITEGEIDALSLAESGIINAVSVPSGASNFAWIENQWDWLQKFEKIILFGDNDDAGRKMIAEIVRKLGENRCYIASHEHKDANEELYYKGASAVCKAVDTARPVPFEGLIDLSDIVPKDTYEAEKIRTHVKWLDQTIGGFLLGELSVWTGKRGEGKSTFLGQMLLEAVNDGHRVCAYSGELTALRFQEWLHRQAAGRNHIKTKVETETGKEYYYLERRIHDKIREWYKGKFFLYDNTINYDEMEENSIIRVFTYAAKRYDCKMFLVDNLMTAPMQEKQDRNYYRRQGTFVGELIRFAKAFNVHVHLVAHPRKSKTDDENDDVSGASEITDRADNVFHIKRLVENEADAIIKITKNRSEGIQNEKIGVVFDKQSKRFYQPSDLEAKNKAYGWEEPRKQALWYEIDNTETLPF